MHLQRIQNIYASARAPTRQANTCVCERVSKVFVYACVCVSLYVSSFQAELSAAFAVDQ